MKRDWDHLNLVNAFHPMPEDCSRAFTEALCSVREEKQVKRATYRAALIAAIILVGTMAVAFAASKLGWIDFFTQQTDVVVPPQTQEALNSSQPLAYQVGPLTFTYQQMLADKHMLLSSAHVQRTDGQDALYAISSQESDPLPNAPMLAAYDLKGANWLEAAQAARLPLYGVRALVELDSAYSTESMESALWEENGTIVYLNMPLLIAENVTDSLPATLFMYVTQLDPETGEAVDSWQAQEKVTVPVTPCLDTRTYAPQSDASFDGLRLDSILGEQYVTGAYFTASFTAPEDMTATEAMAILAGLTLCGEDGSPLPAGLNLSLSIDVDALPTALLEVSAAVEALPEAVSIAGSGVSAVAQ